MLFRVEARVALKHGVLDAPGQAVEASLHRLGFDEVRQVRMGKHITLQVEGADAEAVRARVRAMGERLLANPVVEDFHFDVFAADAVAPPLAPPEGAPSPARPEATPEPAR